MLTVSLACMCCLAACSEDRADAGEGVALAPDAGADTGVEQGEWTLTTETSQHVVPLRADVLISVRGYDADGNPVPSGTAVRLDSVGELSMEFENGTGTAVREFEEEGPVTIRALTSDQPGEATFCASYVDLRLGETRACVDVSVRETGSPTCFGTFTRMNPQPTGAVLDQLSFEVWNGTGPAEGASITVSTEPPSELRVGQGSLGTTELQLETDSAGAAAVYVAFPPGSAPAPVRASTSIEMNGTAIDVECAVPSPVGTPVDDCYFEPFAPELGWFGTQDRRTLRACFTSPVPARPGVAVDFEIVAGHTDATLIATMALTDEVGCASTEIRSGHQAGIVEVRATLSPQGMGCVSDRIRIVGVTPSADNFHINCDPSNTGAFVAAGVECSAVCAVYLSDRFGNFGTWPGEAPEVEIITEGATRLLVDMAGEEARFDLVADVSELRDVLPNTAAGEPAFSDGEGVQNPRDGVLTVVAYLVGEEEFFDANGNGTYEEGEGFVDLAEPFVDANDNNLFEPELGEVFIDVDTSELPSDGVWSAGNRMWDSETLIWTSERVLLTGPPGVVHSDLATPSSTVSIYHLEAE